MKIEALQVDIVELGSLEPEWWPLRTMQEYPGSHRVKFAHRPFEGEGLTGPPTPAFAAIIAYSNCGWHRKSGDSGLELGSRTA